MTSLSVINLKRTNQNQRCLHQLYELVTHCPSREEAVPECGLPGSPKLTPKSTLRGQASLSNHQDNLIIRILLYLGGSTGVATNNRSPQFDEPEHLGLPIAEGVCGGERRTAINHKKIPTHTELLTDGCLNIKHLQVEADSSQT